MIKNKVAKSKENNNFLIFFSIPTRDTDKEDLIPGNLYWFIMITNTGGNDRQLIYLQ